MLACYLQRLTDSLYWLFSRNLGLSKTALEYGNQTKAVTYLPYLLKSYLPSAIYDLKGFTYLHASAAQTGVASSPSLSITAGLMAC